MVSQLLNWIVTPNANALDLLSSSDWNYDAKNGTPYSMINYATQVTRNRLSNLYQTILSALASLNAVGVAVTVSMLVKLGVSFLGMVQQGCFLWYTGLQMSVRSLR